MYKYILFAITLIGIAIFLLPYSRAEAPQRTLEFVMAHKPDNPNNLALMQEFSERVKQRTSGRVNIVFKQPHEVVPETLLSSFSWLDYVIDTLYTGDTDMVQISAKKFAKLSPQMAVVEMPMLFRDHDHAAYALDGEVGHDLKSALLRDSNRNLRGLAFTYSGGFRNFFSTLDLKGVRDMEGLSTRLKTTPMQRDVMAGLGLEQYVTSTDDQMLSRMTAAEPLVEEAETIRLNQYAKARPELVEAVKTVLSTNHTLYLTLIAINEGTFQSLSPEEQEVLQEEVDALAKNERTLSIRQEQDGLHP